MLQIVEDRLTIEEHGVIAALEPERDKVIIVRAAGEARLTCRMDGAALREVAQINDLTVGRHPFGRRIASWRQRDLARRIAVTSHGIGPAAEEAIERLHPTENVIEPQLVEAPPAPGIHVIAQACPKLSERLGQACTLQGYPRVEGRMSGEPGRVSPL